MSDAQNSLLRWLKKHRRRVATAFMLGLLLLLFTHGSTVLPSTVELALPLSDAASIQRVEATLVGPDGEEAHRLSRRFAGDAPEVLDFDVELMPGHYDVELRIDRASTSSVLVGAIDAPSDGRIRVRLTAP